MKKFVLANALSSALILSGCGGGGSDDVAQIITDLEVTVSGQITNLSNVGLSDVAIEGVYADPGGLLDPTTISDTSGNFSLKILKGDAFYLRATKDTFTTLNSARVALNVDETGLEIGMPTEVEAQEIINLVFTSNPPTFADKAWLVVDVVTAVNGDDVAGQTITAVSTPATEAYPDCFGAAGASSTVADCTTDRPGPMYMAYYDASTVITVTVGIETQTAPIRMGEITALEFEVGTFVAGRVKYDADCGICHAAGTHDIISTSGASDLYDKGELLITNISSYSSRKTGVADLTSQEILDLTAFLESPTIKP